MTTVRYDGTRSVSIALDKSKNFGQVIVRVWSTKRDDGAWSIPVVSFESAWDGFEAAYWPRVVDAVAEAFREYEKNFGAPS